MGLFVLLIFIACAVYVQTRGKVRHQSWSRKLSDHSNVLAPINCLFYLFSSIKKSAYIDSNNFPELQILKENWQVIRDEALGLDREQAIKASENYDDLGFNSFFKTGWKRFYLKWYGASLVSAERRCPHTVALLEQIPCVKAGMFAMLPPGARLVKHRDPYAGSLRYHLGLQTPNSDECFISVDGETYSWRDGEAVMFDETFIHFAENQTDENRIVLFLDIKRPVWLLPVDWFNAGFSKVFMAASATKNTEEDRVGALNKIFPAIQRLRLQGKRLKAYNRSLYYAVQYGFYLLLIYWLFF